jgi:WD40 repeat protein
MLALLLATLPAGAQPIVPQLSATEPEEKTSVRVDLAGDPLPAGAVARLGTLRFRYPAAIEAIAFLPDGKTILSGNGDGTLTRWDLFTGKIISGFQAPAAVPLALSPDGKAVALVRPGPSVWLRDLATGRDWRCFRRESGDVNDLAFSRDGQLLAAGGFAEHGGKPSHGTVHVWNVATRDQLRLCKDGSGPVRTVRFAPDSKTVAGGGGRENNHNVIHLWEVATGKRLREFRGHQSFIQSLAFSPDGKALVSAAADKTVRLWQAATGKEIGRLPGQGGKVCTIAFAPDGKTLALAGKSGRSVRLWDLASGKVRRLGPWGGGRRTPYLTFSPDGRILALAGGDRAIRLWDTRSGEEWAFARGHVGAVTTISFSPDGKVITGAEDLTTRHWEPTTGFATAAFPSTENALAFAAAGQTLITLVRENDPIRVWDLGTGRERRRFGGPWSSWADAKKEFWSAMALAPNEKTLIVQKQLETNQLDRWDVASGKRFGRLTFEENVWVLGEGPFSPDSQMAALQMGPSLMEAQVQVVDLATGRVVRRLADQGKGTGWPRFSADGKMLLTRDLTSRRFCLWEVSTGKVRKRWEPKSSVHIALSADGKKGASAQEDGSILVWDVARERKLRRFRGHLGAVKALAFSTDDLVLVSGGVDTTALVWDVKDLAALPAKTPSLSERELAGLWDHLGSLDAGRAYDAINKLIAGGEQSRDFLEKQLRPCPREESNRIGQLVIDLDSPRYRVRVKATRELERKGAQAETALRKALADHPSLEVVMRVEKMLAKLGQPMSDPEDLRMWRALEVVEAIGTPAARQTLAKLARGDPLAPPTVAAQAALKRLGRRVAGRR